MFFSPLEQFTIIPLIYISNDNFSYLFSITNSTLFTFISLVLVCFYLRLVIPIYDGRGFFVPSNIQIIFENLYVAILGMVNDNVNKKEGSKYFIFVFSLFLFIFISNLSGLIPYSFTITSHLIVTIALSLTVFVGVNIIGIRKHGIEWFGLFMPPGAPLGLAVLLVPIEFILYFFRIISLSVRLFANMMAGHTLLKVIVGFSWTIATASGLMFLAHLGPIVILFGLVGLELGVACLQAYVFSILTCIYLNDCLYLH